MILSRIEFFKILKTEFSIGIYRVFNINDMGLLLF